MISRIIAYQENKKNISFQSKAIPTLVTKNFKRKILAATNIDIYTHASPDEDTINAAKVFYNQLNKLGKKVAICTNLKETKGLFFRQGRKAVKESQNSSDLYILLDFNSKERIPRKLFNILINSPSEKKIGLDHHTIVDATLDGDLYIDTSSFSCCELVYKFFKGFGAKFKRVDYESLYCGMLSDYKKSKMITIVNSPEGSKLVKLSPFENDTSSKKVLEEIESKHTQKSF